MPPMPLVDDPVVDGVVVVVVLVSVVVDPVGEIASVLVDSVDDELEFVELVVGDVVVVVDEVLLAKNK